MKDNKFTVVVLNFNTAEVFIIEHTPEDIVDPKAHDDMESYVSALSEVYGFSMEDCQWMAANDDELSIYNYTNGMLRSKTYL